MKSHSAEKPNRSIRPDRVLSNMSNRKNKKTAHSAQRLRQCSSVILAKPSTDDKCIFLHVSSKHTSFITVDLVLWWWRIMVTGHISHCLANTMECGHSHNWHQDKRDFFFQAESWTPNFSFLKHNRFLQVWNIQELLTSKASLLSLSHHFFVNLFSYITSSSPLALDI